MNRRKALLASVAAMAGAGGIGVALWRERQDARAPDEAPAGLWEQRFATPDGGNLAMDTLRGRKLVINFWATWCAPCLRELPQFERFHREQLAHGEKGWHVLALAIDSQAAVREFVAKLGIELPVALAGLEGTDLLRQLGNRQGALPFTVLIRDERVVWRKLGETSRAELSRATGDAA